MLPRDVSALLERLEDRALLSTINWDGGASGTGTVWSTAANWVGDVLPVSGDDAVIDATFSAVTITSSANATVNSVTSDAALAISAGTFTASTAMSINNSLALSGGTLDVTGNTSVTGAFNLSGGTLRHTTVTTTPLLNVANSPTLDGVTLAVNTTLLPGTSGSGNQVTVLNSLTLTNVLLRLDRPYDFDGNFNDSNALDVGLNFSGGTQTLGGTGMVELSNGLVNNNVNDVRVRPTGAAR